MNALSMDRRGFVTAVAGTAVLAHPVKARPPASQRAGAAASRLAKDLFDTKAAPALSLAVARPARLVWSAAYGVSQLELGLPASDEHRFNLGSVSKVITSSAAAKLAAKGALDLDAPISKWLPDLPEQHRKTSLAQLLTHRGGVRHYNRSELDMGSKAGAIYMRIYPFDADVLALFVNDPLVAAPGTSAHYSSYGYTLASVVMQAATGKDFRDLIESEIGLPFSLKSLAADDPWAIVPNRAGKYMNAADIEMLFGSLPPRARPTLVDGWATMPLCNPAYSWAGGGFVITPSDAARFGAAMVDSPHAKIGAAERRLLFTPITKQTKEMPPLGLGWRIDRDKQGRLRWHHAGATGGARYFLAVYPEQQLSIAMAGNVMNMRLDVARAASDLVDIFAA
jgi:CubicO group peptidase (beta-lactamase class C family)